MLVLAIGVPALLAQAAPVDPFTGASPQFSAAPEEGVNYNAGDWGVADQVGAATYTFTIPVPAGRNGMAPVLAMRYSSRSPLRGGIAAGWTLSLPSIERDNALGVDGGLHYKAALGGAVGRLVTVPDRIPFEDADVAYRVDFDGGFTRFFLRKPDRFHRSWTALTSDGIKHHFSSTVVGDRDPRWNIQREEDPSGNTILYFWSPVLNRNGTRTIDFILDRIEYASNPAAGLDAYAKVELEYAPQELCKGAEVPVGAALRPGSHTVEGARRLIRIRTFVRDAPDSGWRSSRQFSFGYETGTSQLYVDEQLVNPEEGAVNPDEGFAVNPDEGVAVNPDEGVAVNPGEGGAVNPGEGRAVNPDEGVAVNPEEAEASNTDTFTTRSCNQNPARYLTRIDIEARDHEGTVTRLSPITFAYNRRLVTTGPIPQPTLFLPGAMAKVEIESPGFAQFGNSGRVRGGILGDALDVDGDGMRDRISVVREDNLCKLVWRKGLLGGRYSALEHKVTLPTAPWYSDWKGRPAPENIAASEGCTLNGQISYRDYMGVVSDLPAKGIVSYHFVDYTGDGRLDLLTNVWATVCHWTYAPQPPPLDGDPCSFASPGPVAAAAPQLSNETSPTSPSFIPMTPEDVENSSGNFGPGSHKFLWRVYPGVNDPDDLFRAMALPTRSLSVRSPLALPPSASEERLDTSTFQIGIQPLVDIDGDGFLDIVDTKDTGLTDCTSELLGQCDWTVYFGDGKRFAEFSDAHLWRVPRFGLSVSPDFATPPDNCGLDYERVHTTFADLQDISGDGLPELVVQSSDSVLKAYVNRGDRFSTGGSFGITGGEVLLNTVSPVERAQTDCVARGVADLLDGSRGYLRRLLDLDADGLLDMLIVGNGDPIADISSGQHNLHARFSIGNRLGPSTKLPPAWEPAKRLLTAEFKQAEDDSIAGKWHIGTDFTDVTGDGLADLAEWDGETMSYIARPGLPAAPDLLQSVENGRGMRIEFSYAPSTDAPAVQWTDPAAALLPQVSWVVKQVKISGGFGTPDMITQYSYENPHYLSPQSYTGTPERSRFVGFDRTTTMGLNRTVRKEYSYLARAANGRLVPAPNGLPVRELTFNGDDLHRVEQITWSYEPLFDGRVQVALPTRRESCIAEGRGVSVAGCLIAGNVHQIEETWMGIAPTTFDDPSVFCDLPCTAPPPKAQLYIRTARVERDSLAPAAGERRTQYEHEVRYGQANEGICSPSSLPCEGLKKDDYRVRVRKTKLEVAGDDLSHTTVAQTETEFSRAAGLPVKLLLWFDHDTVAETTRSYDDATGNLLQETMPAQQIGAGGSGAGTNYAYDAHSLYVQRTTNALGQVIETDFDIATGALTATRGPNKAILPSGISWQQQRWTLDGFGRVLTHGVSVDDQEQGYEVQTIERFTFEDLNSPEAPTLQRVEQLRDFDGDVWVVSERTLDGLGRILSTSQLLGDGRRAETTYAYDERGGLAAVKVPDPRDDIAKVNFLFGRDGLGRLTRFSRPDGTGLSIEYVGRTETRCSVTSDGSGGCTRDVRDVFGRLVEVHELYQGQAPATTLYAYDARDGLQQVTDADGNVTKLSHDWAGHRLAIARGERNWRYAYDLNGRVLEETSPAFDDGANSLHAQRYRYDDLNRVTALSYADVLIDQLPSDARVTPFVPTDTDPVVQEIRYVYDEGQNGTGLLSRVVLQFGEVRYGYDARGQIGREERTVAINGIAGMAPMAVTQSVSRVFNAQGRLTQSTWDDGSRWRIGYDSRGQVQAVAWFDRAARTWREVADYERTLTGLIGVRRSDYSQTRRFTYDALSRPKTDIVALPSGAMIARRWYTYTDAGDLRSVEGETNRISASAVYSYDAHHRLLSAAGPEGYVGVFSYSRAGNLSATAVNWDGSSQERDVQYEYGDADPQAVDRLLTADGAVYASFEYDRAGRMTLRKTPQSTTELVWDDLDQLRLAHGTEGTEIYLYNHAGERVLAISRREGVRFWFGESETHFALDGTQTRRYLHLSGGGATLARVKDGTTVELQYADSLNNLMVALDDGGNVVGSFLYGSFGEVVRESGDQSHRRQFNGKENDGATGLRYYGYRYYDPLALRWNSADPVSRFLPEAAHLRPQGLNLYSFSLNNPLLYYDSDGRQAMGVQDNPENPCNAPEHGWCEQGGNEPDISITFGEEDDRAQGNAEPQEETDGKGAPKSGNHRDSDSSKTTWDVGTDTLDLAFAVGEKRATKKALHAWFNASPPTANIDLRTVKALKLMGHALDVLGGVLAINDIAKAENSVEVAEGVRDLYLSGVGFVPGINLLAPVASLVAHTPVAKDRYGDWATAPEKIADLIVGRPVETRIWNRNEIRAYRKQFEAQPLILDYPVEFQLE
ncbi:MAG: hypothetical protein EOQ56_23025 [Mesorhizobium sp.]|nr:MAG: hypothetical protein EOQ56_23025 [Mesorhizobium sp.]